MGEGKRRRLLFAARAKLNLGLELIKKRPDGYHEIKTLMQSISLADRIAIEPARGETIKLHCPGSDLPVDQSNLVMRAAELLRKRTGVRKGARIRLEKRIPVGAGLGGGSSDAAVTLVGLNRLWDLRLRHKELEEIGSEIGSDVPFFIRGGTQLAEGRGEKLSVLPPIPHLRVFVVFPGLFVPTAAVYKAAKIPLTGRRGATRMQPGNLATRSCAVSYISGLQNDLEPVVTDRYREVGDLLRTLRVAGIDVVRVTGSGSSLFLLCDDMEVLRRALGRLPIGDCQVFKTWFVKRGWISIGSREAGTRN